ncbi:MAG: protein-export chaperone SecB [Pseudomonadota bacterium]
MAENETNAAAPGAEAPRPKLQVRNQFVRDLSFENIASQKGTLPKGNPDVKVGVKLDAKKLSDTDFEVVMTIEVKAMSGDDPLFLMEMDYVGIFQIGGVPQEQLHPFLMIECPRMIFPFVRRVVSDVTRDGGFPPVNVDSIDFLQLYRQELLRRQAAQQQQAEGAPAGTA